MKQDDINKLISLLLAIYNYAKDIHYNCSGESFYSNHLLADRIAENLNEYIDQLKEICLLGNGIKPLDSGAYLMQAKAQIPANIGFRQMANLLADALKHIQKTSGTSKADENLLGAIAQEIQNNLGLLNIMFGD